MDSSLQSFKELEPWWMQELFWVMELIKGGKMNRILRCIYDMILKPVRMPCPR